jgi:hypothetical protein
MGDRADPDAAADLWPCATCGAPGVRNLGTQGFCATHLAELLRSFDGSAFAFAGVGLPGASTDQTCLTCCACSATWHGTPGERCPWCARARESQIRWQAAALLEPPDLTGDDDETRERRLRAWGERLLRGCDAGIVNHGAAQRAWRRAVTP